MKVRLRVSIATIKCVILVGTLLRVKRGSFNNYSQTTGINQTDLGQSGLVTTPGGMLLRNYSFLFDAIISLTDAY